MHVFLIYIKVNCFLVIHIFGFCFEFFQNTRHSFFPSLFKCPLNLERQSLFVEIRSWFTLFLGKQKVFFFLKDKEKTVITRKQLCFLSIACLFFYSFPCYPPFSFVFFVTLLLCARSMVLLPGMALEFASAYSPVCISSSIYCSISAVSFHRVLPRSSSLHRHTHFGSLLVYFIFLLLWHFSKLILSLCTKDLHWSQPALIQLNSSASPHHSWPTSSPPHPRMLALSWNSTKSCKSWLNNCVFLFCFQSSFHQNFSNTTHTHGKSRLLILHLCHFNNKDSEILHTRETLEMTACHW